MGRTGGASCFLFLHVTYKKARQGAAGSRVIYTSYPCLGGVNLGRVVFGYVGFGGKNKST